MTVNSAVCVIEPAKMSVYKLAVLALCTADIVHSNLASSD